MLTAGAATMSRLDAVADQVEKAMRKFNTETQTYIGGLSDAGALLAQADMARGSIIAWRQAVRRHKAAGESAADPARTQLLVESGQTLTRELDQLNAAASRKAAASTMSHYLGGTVRIAGQIAAQIAQAAVKVGEGVISQLDWIRRYGLLVLAAGGLVYLAGPAILARMRKARAG
jgi:hypothetical protein